MSEALFLKQAYVNVNAPLKNGLGRFIPQLMRITLKFCKEKPSSANVREFIEKDIVEFAKQNPGTAIYLKPRRNREPVVVAEYCKFQCHGNLAFLGPFLCNKCSKLLDLELRFIHNARWVLLRKFRSFLAIFRRFLKAKFGPFLNVS